MEKPLRKSTRARSMSEHYISVECRVRCAKSRRRPKKGMTEIKQEPEDEPTLTSSSCNLASSSKLESPTTTKLQKDVKSPKKSSKGTLKVKIKDEPTEKSPGLTKTVVTQLSSINDDVEFIQQSIKEEPKPPENPKSKKHRIKMVHSDGHKCSSCGRIYKYRKGMLQHQRLECNLEPQFPCPYCPLKFRYRHQIQKHVYEQHNQAFARWYKLFYITSVNTNPKFVKRERQNHMNQN